MIMWVYEFIALSALMDYMNSYVRGGIWKYEFILLTKIWIHIIIYTEPKRRERLTFKTIATSDAAAAAGEALNATASAIAADIKEERLRGLSAPAERVAFADAAAAPEEVLNAITSANAADINEVA